MTKLVWDHVGDRLYETGLDKGVLYLSDGTGVAWNGLTSAGISSESAAIEPIYFDGKKIFDLKTPGNFAGTISAITFPDEFIEYDGVSSVSQGVFLDSQPVKTFSLSYRTLIGDELEGTTAGYKIHVLYNLTAVSDVISYQTIGSNVDPITFSWAITSVPEQRNNHRQTGHVIFDSTKMDPIALIALEDLLYGTGITEPTLPNLNELLTPFVVTITDNGNGTWTAEGPDYLVSMLDLNTFQILWANATYLNPYTYKISST